MPSSQPFSFKHTAVLTVACLSLTAVQAQTPVNANQLPNGSKLVGGSATINNSGNTLNINQTSNRAAIEWNQFNVGSDARVNFIQPSAASVTLNRVVGGDPSSLAEPSPTNTRRFLWHCAFSNHFESSFR
jgi:large exoprotein involved in heme utilization and adhesion